MTVHVQEVEEATVGFVPATLKGKLHKLFNSSSLDLLVIVVGGVPQQEPAGFQGVAWVSTRDTAEETAKQAAGNQETYLFQTDKK